MRFIIEYRVNNRTKIIISKFLILQEIFLTSISIFNFLVSRYSRNLNQTFRSFINETSFVSSYLLIENRYSSSFAQKIISIT